MHALSNLTLVQMGLVLLGLIFQAVALTWIYRDSEAEHGDGGHDEWDRKIDLGNRNRKSARALPRHSVHDYYDMEKTPAGVRPADLRKTARVTYMDNVKTQNPGD